MTKPTPKRPLAHEQPSLAPEQEAQKLAAERIKQTGLVVCLRCQAEGGEMELEEAFFAGYSAGSKSEARIRELEALLEKAEERGRQKAFERVLEKERAMGAAHACELAVGKCMIWNRGTGYDFTDAAKFFRKMADKYRADAEALAPPAGEGTKK